MRQAVVSVLGIAILTGFVGTTQVSADPITITAGQAVATLANGSFSFTGKGLSAGAGLPDGWAVSVVNECSPCSADQPVTLSFSSICTECLSEGSTGNTLGGVVYPAATTFGANFDFKGPTFSSSEVTPDHLVFTAPFTMTGSLAAFTAAFDPNPPFFTTDLVGRGTATIMFTPPIAGGGGLFEAERITYDFSSAPSATPEPASLLLFGSGALLFWRRRAARS